MRKVPAPLNLEKDPIWVATNAIVERVYSVLHELPEEEKWDTTTKLRSAAINLLFEVGEAAGTAAPASNEYEWGNARRHVSSLKTMYRFAGRQKFIELDPEVMVQIDKLITAIDERVAAAYEQTAAQNEHDLAHWREKYRLSQGDEHETQS